MKNMYFRSVIILVIISLLLADFQYPELKRIYIQGRDEKEKINNETIMHKIRLLEEKLASFEFRVSTTKVYPDVKFRPQTERKRILVTGGAGFVGSHLVDRLMMDGQEVHVVDNFFTGRHQNIKQWVGHENFEMIHHDIVIPLYIEVDQIYHLASPASPPHYMYNPIKTIKTNTAGTMNVLGLAKRTKSRILLASTSEVYGDPTVHPQSEEYLGNVNPIGPRACYDEGKRVAEAMAYSYEKYNNVSVRVARIFNTYGPRMFIKDGRVISNFIVQCLEKKPITIYGAGEQTRSFQYVDDLVSGLIALMESNYSKPVNIGNPEEYSIKSMAHLIRDIVGGNSSVVHMPAIEDDPQKRQPNITLAKSILNWTPKVTVKLGLKKTIEYFEKELTMNSFWK